MVALRHIALACAVIALTVIPSGSSGAAPADSGDSLFTQSAAKVLSREFTNPNVSYLLLDARTGQLLASRWDNANAPIPMGSLVKPFTALAYGEQHGFVFPPHLCRGTASGCWLPRGHGRMNLTTAIAYSCNSYFQMLASQLNAQQISLIATDFGVESPDSTATGPALVGIGRQWLISPMKMARAYLELVRRRNQPGIHEIVDGMTLSARQGTGAAVDRALPHGEALAKTGTAPCTHAKRAPGDGFAIAVWPAEQPRILLLLRVHGVPGAQAAKTAGAILQRIGE